ncbi:non-specific lipid-transfer protein-like protein At2g13820 isoform X2 [Punica granatum]|uniref:Non-specific lipid-transfer protein-like protein At2g13820 isoform X2 n=1 Tax=Punica granatum TaxID=22663 RepID=A0A6P8DRL4_PUNGR|nr:non-specific lipid-transfer protein-like protein At2g13820 isoform X2 [Punica granatum]
MAPITKVGAVALAVAALLWEQVAAQSNCMSVLIGLSPCLNFVTGSSSTPSSSCCSQLASVVQSQPQCLCMVLNNGGASLGVTINQTQALALPGACNVQTPPVSRCNAGSPQALPGNNDTPSDSSVTGGSKATSSSSSNANPMAISVRFILLSLFVASCVSGVSAV